MLSPDAHAGPAAGTASREEIARFDRIARAWWDPDGDFKPLHRLNPVRVGFIRDEVCAHFGIDPASTDPFHGLSVLDVGCGGGLVTEAAARLGAAVTGIDASAESVRVAEHHAQGQGLHIRYRHAAPEELARAGERFDVLLALEVIEHVADPDGFLSACRSLIRPGGAIALSTINRTIKSLLLAKIGAEYVLRWLPVGTHDWRKFVRPSELSRALNRHGLQLSRLSGLSYNPLSGTWSLSRDLDVNYIGFAA